MSFRLCKLDYAVRDLPTRSPIKSSRGINLYQLAYKRSSSIPLLSRMLTNNPSSLSP
jgi:hypothetical protein